MKYNLATSTWDEKEIRAIKRVIKSDKYSMSDEVLNYEKNFSSFFGSKYAVMTSSGSTANLIMIATLFYHSKYNLRRGDEIIVPAVSWSTTYFPLQQYGLKLKFIDIDINTLNYNLSDLSNAITEKTKAIMVVNLLGNPNDFNSLKKTIKDKNIILIEDNCESMGAKFDGKYCGTFGLMGTFSSFFSHHIATMEGGVVLTDDEEAFHILLSLRAHGWTRNLPKNNLISKKSENWFEESFNFILPGYNVRPLEMSGAIGTEQLKKLPSFIKQRRNNAKLFTELFRNDNRFIIQKEVGESSWFGFSILLNDIDRKKVIESLEKANIEYRPIVTGNFVKNKVMRFFDFEVFSKLENADKLDKCGFFVGNSHEGLTNEIKYLHKVLNNF